MVAKLKAVKKTKWQLKRERLMQNETYRRIIQRIEGDDEMFHRIRLASVVKRDQPGAAYSPIYPGQAFYHKHNPRIRLAEERFFGLL